MAQDIYVIDQEKTRGGQNIHILDNDDIGRYIFHHHIYAKYLLICISAR